MRITGGEFGGRKIKGSDDDSIRPSTDKVRQAIFNMLAARVDIEGFSCLDLFCGAGSLGLEALSRGVGFCTFVDFSKNSLAVAKANIEALGAQDKSKLLKGDAIRPHKLPLSQDVDLVFMDPPYAKGHEDRVLEHLHECFWLGYNAYVVVETDRNDVIIPDYFDVQAHKDYGRSKIHLLQYKGV